MSSGLNIKSATLQCSEKRAKSKATFHIEALKEGKVSTPDAMFEGQEVRVLCLCACVRVSSLLC